MNAMAGLAQLCHGDPTTAESLEVMVESSGPWLRVLEQPDHKTEVRCREGRLVPGDAVTPRVVERWIDNWAKIGSLADPAVNGLKDVLVEFRVFTLSAVGEGFHSRPV